MLSNPNTFPLSQAPKGRALILNNIEGGRKFNHRLVELGLTPGVRLRVLQDSGGPLIIAVRDSRLALGRGMAKQIFVSVVEEA